MNEKMGAIEFPDLRGMNTKQSLECLLCKGLYGRVYGWGIWREMNIALRDLSPGGAKTLSREQSVIWNGFTIRQSGKVRWSIEKYGHKVIIWDLWNFAKRPMHSGDTPLKLHYAIGRVSKSMGVKPRGYFGYGNLASPILRINKVADYIPSDENSTDYLSMSAFYGGRIQQLRIGHSRKPVYEYDLNSAYAWGLYQLPEVLGVGPPNLHTEWGLVHTEWDIPRQFGPIYPFPVRDKDQQVDYPRTGRGWYWSPLVEEASDRFGKYIRTIDRIPIITSNNRPFKFIKDLYESRMAMTNPLDASIAKATLSSLWGKLCQRDNGQVWKHKFRHITWSGMATSLVQAELLRVAMRNPDSVWSFGVDSIISDTPNLDEGRHGYGLGEWKSQEFDRIEAYQPGIWRGFRPNGTWKTKSRGIPEGVFDWEKASKEWKKYGSFGRVETSWEEFVGLSSLSGNSDQWLSSRTVEILVYLHPGGVKRKEDFAKAGAGGVITWEPPNEIKETGNFSDSYGIDHRADAAQEELQ